MRKLYESKNFIIEEDEDTLTITELAFNCEKVDFKGSILYDLVLELLSKIK